MEQPDEQRSPNLRSIVDRIRPSIRTLKEANPGMDREELLELSVRANVRASVNQLRHASSILENLTTKSGLMIVGAEYALETGIVTFFDE